MILRQERGPRDGDRRPQSLPAAALSRALSQGTLHFACPKNGRFPRHTDRPGKEDAVSRTWPGTYTAADLIGDGAAARWAHCDRRAQGPLRAVGRRLGNRRRRQTNMACGRCRSRSSVQTATPVKSDGHASGQGGRPPGKMRTRKRKTKRPTPKVGRLIPCVAQSHQGVAFFTRYWTTEEPNLQLNAGLVCSRHTWRAS